jgi:DNA-binding transcriptional MerR regulator
VVLEKERTMTTDDPSGIRYYERQGLVSPEARTEAGYRLYGLESLRRVKFIRKAQDLGFSLKDIAQLLYFGVDQDATKADVFGLTAQKIEAHPEKIRGLEALRRILAQVAERCAADASPVSDCPILAYLYPVFFPKQEDWKRFLSPDGFREEEP